MRNKKVKSPARPPASIREAFRAGNATRRKSQKKLLTEMDTDEILEAYGYCVAGGEKRELKKRKRMRVSGKSVFKIKVIIDKKSEAG